MTQRLLSFGLCCALALSGANSASSSDVRETPTVKAVNRARPSVVDIHTEKPAAERDSVFASGKGKKINGMGTGVVLDERGYILTNFHVVEEVDTIRCRLHDGSDYDARVISFDRDHDLAVIKIEPARPLTVAYSGTSSDLMLGETVIAIGNAYGYHGTITQGIVSALGRDVEVTEKQSYKNLIQTDASINPGNSGGPLINLHGEVVAVNVAIRAGAQRIGFAIPIDDARKIVARLISIEQLNQTYHGLVGKDVKSGATRMLVVDGAQPESPAALAGLKAGDVVVKAGSVDVTDGADWERALIGKNAGDTIDVVVRRHDKTETLALAVGQKKHGKSSLNTEVVVSRANNDSEAEHFWGSLGLKLASLPKTQVSLVSPQYRGGMRVLDVRPDSPAHKNGMRKGDILVGLQLGNASYETLNSANVSWILAQPDSKQPIKFWLVRGAETLYGNLQVASNKQN